MCKELTVKVKARLNEPRVLNRNNKYTFHSENSVISLESKLNFELTEKQYSNIDWSENINIEIDIPEKKIVLSSISDNDLFNELIDRLIVNTKHSDREKLFEIVSKTWKKRLFGENK